MTHTSPIPSTLPRSRHVLCRTTMLYQVARLNFCPCERTFRLLLRQSSPHTFEQPADLFHTLYMQPTPFATLYTHLLGALQRVWRKCTSFHSLTYGRSHTLFNNLRIFSTHCTRHLSLWQHSIIIYQRYIFRQNEVCRDC